jgi:hypothetical protein
MVVKELDDKNLIVEDQKTLASKKVDLAIIIPSLHEADNLAILLPDLVETLEPLTNSYKIIVVDRTPDEATREISQEYPVVLLDQGIRVHQ